MKPAISIAAFCTFLVLPLGQAQAGACTGEIENLAKTIAATDAGSGPTSGAVGPASGAAAPSGDTAQHPPTGRMSQEVQGRATSPQDVRQQTEGKPTAADQAQGARAATSAEKAEAATALNRARLLDSSGKEAECMEAIQQAKRHWGK